MTLPKQALLAILRCPLPPPWHAFLHVYGEPVERRVGKGGPRAYGAVWCDVPLALPRYLCRLRVIYLEGERLARHVGYPGVRP